MKITKDTKVWDQMKRNLLKGSGKELKVGWFNDVYGPENDYLPVAQVAKWNEEGHRNGGLFAGTVTPPRPFLRIGFISQCEKFLPFFVKSAQLIAEGKSTFETEYRKLGPEARKELQEVIDDWMDPPNGPMTEQIKGFNNPLIDTETMRNSVGFMVGKEE